MPITAFRFEVKQLDEQGTFTGLASTYEVDSGSDQIMPGAFDVTLAGNKQRPLLYGHRDPIGVVELTDSPQGLIARGRLTMPVQQAKDAYELMKSGALTGLSIGFQSLKDTYVGGIRQISSLKLYELSLTATPMNDGARILSVKSSVQYQQQIQTALRSFRQEVLSALERRS